MQKTSTGNFIQLAKNISKTELSGKSQLKRRRPALDCSVIEAEEKPKTQRLIVALFFGYAGNTKQ
jgi:hypothetical protein